MIFSGLSRMMVASVIISLVGLLLIALGALLKIHWDVGGSELVLALGLLLELAAISVLVFENRLQAKEKEGSTCERLIVSQSNVPPYIPAERRLRPEMVVEAGVNERMKNEE